MKIDCSRFGDIAHANQHEAHDGRIE